MISGKIEGDSVDYFVGKRMKARYEQVQCFSKAEMERRFCEVRKAMDAEGVDVLFILEGYWEGYSQWLIGDAGAEIVVVPRDGPITACYGDHYIKECEKYDREIDYKYAVMPLPVEPVHEDIRYVRGFSGYEVRKQLKEYERAVIGFVHLESLRADLKEYLSGIFPHAEYKDISLSIDVIKAVKSVEEQVMIRNAVSIHEKVMAALPAYIMPGRTIRQIDSQTRKLCHDLGSGGSSCICSVMQYGNDEEGPLTYQSGLKEYPQRPLKKGDRIFMMLEANGIGGHFTAIGRNFCLGEPDEKIQEYWDAAVKMQDFAAGMLRPGVTVREIFEENVRYIESMGYQTNQQNYLHSFGYVFGEKPYLHDKSETIPLRENMIYVNHPHVRIDRGKNTGKALYDNLFAFDTYLVTKEGGIIQNKVPRSLFVIE